MSLSAAASSMSERHASAADGTAGPAASLESTLLRAQRGELAAFRDLIRAHQNSVYTLTLRMLKVPEDAEELAQDIFVSFDIYLRRNGDHTDGVAIIAAEPRELTIVNIVGSIDLSRLVQLQGQFGVPKVGITVNGQAKSGSASGQTH